ncbi:glycoside hydrolase family 31 protein [Paenibacillus pasadenensis]|uniref:glycoside hydrolase family 31 protein n=1 Tax=Paenibacillus pasadenensis TaxID=217090 RepID=UPI00203C31CD|nr:glycoside hydrolase family 31 protein [Paenibacillus pasadenensis]MCM3746959.1 glycoside hydrolase family 31 protein [Paenibacillus pasadenensis]
MKVSIKAWLVILQVIGAVCLVPWLVVIGLSFMAFDSGFSWFAVMLVAVIGSYPVVWLGGVISSWLLYKRQPKLALTLSGMPLLWPAVISCFVLS